MWKKCGSGRTSKLLIFNLKVKTFSVQISLYRMYLLYHIFVSFRKGDRIYEQQKLMGISVDWDRACFTMEPVSNNNYRTLLFDGSQNYRKIQFNLWEDF